MKIEKVSAALLEPGSGPKKLSPREQARTEQERRIARMLSGLSGPDVAYRIRPEGDEKLSTIEARIRKMAKASGKQVLLRKMENSVVVGLRNGRTAPTQ